MKLRYIGKDGDLGLEHGREYDVDIYTKYNFIVVRWGKNECCPYSTPAKLSENWEGRKKGLKNVCGRWIEEFYE